MAFSDLISSFLRSRTSDDAQASQLVERAVEQYNRLDVDPNDVEAFEELASIIRTADESKNFVDPLRAGTDHEDEYSADLVLWSLSEEVGSASTAWYPLIQLARLSIDDDPASATRYLEIASDREPTGLALSESIKVLREAGHFDAATQLGLGRWHPNSQQPVVGEELIEAALASHKKADAQVYLDRMREAGANPELVDDLAVRVATEE